MTLAALVAAGCDGPAEELDLGVAYSSLTELEDASTTAVLFTTTEDRRVEGDPDLPFTVTSAVVAATDARGDLEPGQGIEIRQMQGRFSNIAPTLDPDQSYVAYLKPWTSFDPDDTEGDGQLVVVGGQSVWRVKGDTGSLTTPDSLLPDRVAVTTDGGVLAVTS
ncbi:hypothetical protein ATJ88_0441 [Isoptericola jiangsuensis]|uniref:Uncharacterized protein n=1 Tax=Isoptericola jiangsuensis TaxID=548579 RepID=A0A2A9ESD7_9MICO|nr:hypothetical protein [Isoptericola jiangsuensis]PFG41798.1 hypothetical protein ATJ88_0441 [Isoptericola jiangsuensis]